MAIGLSMSKPCKNERSRMLAIRRIFKMMPKVTSLAGVKLYTDMVYCRISYLFAYILTAL